MKKRLDWLDVAKGIGIIMVVVEHCIFICHDLIYVVNMPFWFFIAGLTFKIKPVQEFALQKLNRLVIPFLFWSVLGGFLDVLYPNMNGGGPFFGPIWVLAALCWSLAFMYITVQLPFKAQVMVVIAALAYTYFFFGKQFVAFQIPFNFQQGIAAFPFTWLGFVIRDHVKRDYSKRVVYSLFPLLLAAFFGLFVMLMMRNHSIDIFIFGGLFRHDFLLVLLCSVIGVLTILCFSRIITKSKPLQFLGRHTLVIMSVHFPIATIYNVIASRTNIYTSGGGKIILGIIEYILVFAICLLAVWFCRRYIPKLTGYANAIG